MVLFNLIESDVRLLDLLYVVWHVFNELFIINLVRPLFGNVRMCKSRARLDGQVAVVTGANRGIGMEAAKDLSLRGAKVIMACRDVAVGQRVARKIQEASGGEVVVMHLDLASMASVRKFADQLIQAEPKINILINNAGVFLCPQSATEDGFEMHFGVNYLGHFLLTLLLLDKLKNSAPARIVNLTSSLHRIGSIHFDDFNLQKGYSGVIANEQGQLARVLFTQELAKRLARNNVCGVTVYAVHPGVAKTDVFRFVKNKLGLKFLNWCWNGVERYLTKTAFEGAQTTIYCAVDEEAKSQSGLYYEECSSVFTRTKPEVAKKLWELSCDLAKIPEFKQL